MVISNMKQLRLPCDEIAEFDAELKSLVNRMKFIMKRYKGVGLAAPQVGINKSLFIWDIGEGFGAAINPKLETSGEEITGPEGCLSIPNKYYPITRFTEATLSAYDIEGNEFEAKAVGWLARCFQHEFDHLNQMVITDRLYQK